MPKGKTAWNLVASQLDPADTPAQLFAYADAYLDSAARLCMVLARSTRKATFERGAVVLFLAAHSVELFLKGAILKRAPNERFSHDLQQLHRRYTALHPEKRFHFANPFGMSENPPREWGAIPKPPDESERFRYPGDKNYVPWPGVDGFEARSFLSVLDQLKLDFSRLRMAYRGGDTGKLTARK